ncbi:hypothetical protein [Pontibacter chinhatensis]|uniref:Uncharacterized protein n=1 Tax=Pontibacter chinhatensis TaxID=1436961 RepID=A0A1I2ZGP0_9BACT|nr:hypothetical protein [Pontibacter chinhatensis]SFH37007.1 hypothetical protein SAMN05421739_1141 [Pontibacter chinhatensis]
MLIVPEEDIFIDKEKQGGYKSIGIVTDKLDKCIAKYQQENFNGIFGNPSFGFKNVDFDFVKDFKDAKFIWFWNINVNDITGLYNLENAEYFGVLGKRPLLDFSNFRSLKTLVLEWHQKDKNLYNCENIEHFDLWHHKPKDKSFADFSFPRFAKKVGLNWTNVEDLTTLNGLKGMSEISIDRSRNLKSLRGLETYADTIEKLYFDTCNKLSDYTFILDFPKLQSAVVKRIRLK